MRLFSATAQLVTTGHRRVLRLSKHWPWTAPQRLAALPVTDWSREWTHRYAKRSRSPPGPVRRATHTV
ncbi:hypothetical protein CLM62_14185 [Streptomyces sp. SA15]|nr:hypothetical protein CLM62_14185 [Streptomyces sp. SA15]